MSVVPETSRPSPPRRAVVPLTAALLAAVVAVGVLLVAIGALVPASGAIATVGPVLVHGSGPGLVVAAVAAVVVAALALVVGRGGRAALRGVLVAVLVLALAAAVAITVVVGAVLAATTAAGGSVDLVRAVLPIGGASPEPDLRIGYGAGPDGAPLALTVQRPRDAAAGAPIVVDVHGGGWIQGSDLDRAADMRRWADRGWLAISVDYTLARPGLPTWDVAGPEVACALTQIAARAPTIGADPNRIVLAGDSAGGQLAVSVAYHAAAGDQRSSCGGRVPVPRAVAVEYPAVDPVAVARGGAAEAPVAYTGGTPEQVPERYRAVSGLAAITPAAPPTLVLSPARDTTVPPDSVAAFAEAARRAGVDTTLVSIPYAEHAFDTGGDGTLGQQVGFSIMERWASQRVGRP